MTISSILTSMRKSITSSKYRDQIDPKIIENIRKIKQICLRDYSDQRTHGGAALNRLILLDERIAKLLTPETILAIIAIHAKTKSLDSKSDIAIWRNTTGFISLASTLFYGFNEGINIIKLMSNNENSYDTKKYSEQKNKFENNTKLIAYNILQAAKLLDINPNIDESTVEKDISLTQLFSNVENVVDQIKHDGKSDRMLYAPGFIPLNMKGDVVKGFYTICKELNILYKSTGDSIVIKDIKFKDFVDNFSSSNEILLHPDVTHMFYDRIHLEACLTIDNKIIFEDGEFKFKDIIREMAQNCDSSDSLNKRIAKEQLRLRLQLVDSHLKKQFPTYYKDEKKSLKDSDSCVEIKRALQQIEEEIDEKLWSFENLKALYDEKNILQKTIEYYDKAQGENSIKDCLLLAAKENPQAFDALIEKKGEAFIANILSKELSDNLEQGPRIKNQATIMLEKLVHNLLNGYKSLNCYFNPFNELEIKIDNHIFNITQILKNQPDFEHIQFSSKQLDNYKDYYLASKNERFSDEYYKKHDTENEFQHLQYGEKMAITLYTTQFYATIQNFLRNNGINDQTKFSSQDELNNLIPKILLSVSIASHALSKNINAKITNTEETSYRKENAKKTDDFFKERTTAAKSKTPKREKGFVSTSENNSFKEVSNTTTIFNEVNSGSSLGKNIKAFSKHAAENEKLYSPGTQFQYTDYLQTGNQHFFAARPVRALNEINPNTYTPTTIAWHELEIILKILNDFIKKNTHSRIRSALFDTVSNKEKIACVQSAIDLIQTEKTTAGNHTNLDIETLYRCQQALNDAIDANAKLVKNATRKASLGKTDKVLNSALLRIENAIEVVADDAKRIEEIRNADPGFVAKP